MIQVGIIYKSALLTYLLDSSILDICRKRQLSLYKVEQVDT